MSTGPRIRATTIPSTPPAAEVRSAATVVTAAPPPTVRRARAGSAGSVAAIASSWQLAPLASGRSGSRRPPPAPSRRRCRTLHRAPARGAARVRAPRGDAGRLALAPRRRPAPRPQAPLPRRAAPQGGSRARPWGHGGDPVPPPGRPGALRGYHARPALRPARRGPPPHGGAPRARGRHRARLRDALHLQDRAGGARRAHLRARPARAGAQRRRLAAAGGPLRRPREARS